MGGRYQAYPEYKDSGIEWLDKMPKYWQSKKLKWEISAKSGVDSKVTNGRHNLYGANGIIGLTNTVSICSPTGKVIVGRVGSAGAVTYVDEISGISDNALIIDNQYCDIPRFDFYLIQSLNLEELVSKNAQPLITASNIRDIKVALPAEKIERIKIASFLDHETAKIDTLIEKQQQLIALLGEKRQAVISHAVTKGLNPDAPMKDSGVEWLGEVPEHWKIRRFKSIFRIQKRIVGELGYQVLSITQKGIKVKDIESREGQLSMDYSKYQKVHVGDFAMNHMDLLTGFVDISNFSGVTSPDYRVFTLVDTDQYYPQYYLYFLQRCYIERLFFPFGRGAAHLGRWRLPTQAFNEFLVPFPSYDEQVKIAKRIGAELEKLELLKSKALEAIELFQERRTALISAAVTGKIDVRNWQPPTNKDIQ